MPIYFGTPYAEHLPKSTLRDVPMNISTSLQDKPRNPVRIFDLTIASAGCVILSPIFIYNFLSSKIEGKPYLTYETKFDKLGRTVILSRWTSGISKQSSVLIDLLLGKISLCGISISPSLIPPRRCARSDIPTGIFSAFETHQLTGGSEFDFYSALKHHENNYSLKYNLSIIVRGIFNKLFYSPKNTRHEHKFKIFDIPINNVSMSEALDWITRPNPDSLKNGCRTVYFINTNSVNTAHNNDKFKSILASSDKNFPDGSGVRIAAKRYGIQLRDNVNGTDLLPGLCRESSEQKKSIFLLGSAPGVAEQTARKIQALYPRVEIVGTHHGYFDLEDSSSVIDRINASGAHICLVGLGSPHQETWLHKNRQALKVETALAVGGLFDFYSGNIPRAPLWMREMGLEWVFRLIQEPKKKFSRYVLGLSLIHI